MSAAPMCPWYLMDEQTRVGDELEEFLHQHRHSRVDSTWATLIEPKQSQLSSHCVCSLVAVCGRASATAVYVWSEIVNLFAILICYNGALRRTGICPKNNPILRNQTSRSGSTLNTNAAIVVPVFKYFGSCVLETTF